MKTMIDAEFEKFFEFPTSDRSTVSSVSCKLFAAHVLDVARKASGTTERERFENVISKSPYELMISRYPNTHNSAWPDAYKEYKVQLCWDVCRDFAAPLHAEIEALKAKLEPNQLWLYEDPENSFATTMENLVQEHADNCFDDPNDFVGCEFMVMRSVRLPVVTVEITGYTTNEDGEWSGWEWVEK